MKRIFVGGLQWCLETLSEMENERQMKEGGIPIEWTLELPKEVGSMINDEKRNWKLS